MNFKKFRKEIQISYQKVGTLVSWYYGNLTSLTNKKRSTLQIHDSKKFQFSIFLKLIICLIFKIKKRYLIFLKVQQPNTYDHFYLLAYLRPHTPPFQKNERNPLNQVFLGKTVHKNRGSKIFKITLVMLLHKYVISSQTL